MVENFLLQVSEHQSLVNIFIFTILQKIAELYYLSFIFQKVKIESTCEFQIWKKMPLHKQWWWKDNMLSDSTVIWQLHM